jgi:hypothetical protein
VATATLPDDVRATVTWCLDQLPGQYRELDRTYDARHSDEVRRLVEALLGALRAAGARQAAEAVTLRLVAMHERLGIPSLGLKPGSKKAS